MSVSKIMTQSVVTVEMDDPLSVVKEIFDNARFHHLLVVEKGRLTGVISDRDLFRAISPNLGTAAETRRDVATLNKRAHQIMTRKPISLTAEAGVHDAVRVFNRHNVSCIPIVDRDNKPIGIISWRDILRALESVWAAQKNDN